MSRATARASFLLLHRATRKARNSDHRDAAAHRAAANKIKLSYRLHRRITCATLDRNFVTPRRHAL